MYRHVSFCTFTYVHTNILRYLCFLLKSMLTGAGFWCVRNLIFRLFCGFAFDRSLFKFDKMNLKNIVLRLLDFVTDASSEEPESNSRTTEDEHFIAAQL